MVRNKGLQSQFKLDATEWGDRLKQELMQITGRTQWTSMYSIVRVATCPDEVWTLVVRILDMWDSYQIKGLIVPSEKKGKGTKRVPKELRHLKKSKPAMKAVKNPKPFPSTMFEKMVTGIQLVATFHVLKDLISKKIGFSSVTAVSCVLCFCFDFVLLLTCSFVMMYSWCCNTKTIPGVWK
jgi:hypothetical protein